MGGGASDPENFRIVKENMKENIEKIPEFDKDRTEAIRSLDVQKLTIRWDGSVRLIKDLFPEVYEKEAGVVRETSGRDLEYFLSDFMDGYQVPVEVHRALKTFHKFFAQTSPEQLFETAEKNYESAMNSSDFDSAIISARYLRGEWLKMATKKKFEKSYEQILNAKTKEKRSDLARTLFFDTYAGEWTTANKEAWKTLLKYAIDKGGGEEKIFDALIKLIKYGCIDLKGEERISIFFHPFAREIV